MGGRDLASTFGAIVTLASACSGTVDPTPMPDTAKCPDPQANPYAAITLAPGVDGIFFYYASRNGNASPFVVGTPCATATNHDDCITRAQAASAQSTGWDLALGPFAGMNHGSGVATAGDTVTPLALDSLTKAIVPIDSLDEAATLVMFSDRYVNCQAKNADTNAKGYQVDAIVGGCPGPEYQYIYEVDRVTGAITEAEKNKLSNGDSDCVEGRRPAGYVAAERPWLASLPAHLAEIAHMEAAAVLAFADLHRSLVELAAPRALVDRVDDARGDEIAHAAMMARLARAFGGSLEPVTCVKTAPPTLLSLALENATEGCVREAYGALVAAYQARHARVPALRRAFERLAHDEAAHAELSLDLAAWFATQLSAKENACVAAAASAAWVDLARSVAVEPSLAVQRDAGMPSARAAAHLLEALIPALAA